MVLVRPSSRHRLLNNALSPLRQGWPGDDVQADAFAGPSASAAQASARPLSQRSTAG